MKEYIDMDVPDNQKLKIMKLCNSPSEFIENGSFKKLSFPSQTEQSETLTKAVSYYGEILLFKL